MSVPKRLSVAAVIGILALLGGALIGATADAKKKKGGSKAKTLRAKTKPIPDSFTPCTDPDGFGGPLKSTCNFNGQEFTNGVLASPIKVPKSLDGTKVKDINAQVTIAHTEPNDLSILIVGPGGKIVFPYGFSGFVFENPPVGFMPPPSAHFFTVAGKLGPTTFDDQAAVDIDDFNSCPNPQNSPPIPGECDPAAPNGFPDGGGVEAFSPYAGAFRPADGTVNSLAKKLKAGQAFWLFVYDNDPPNQCSTPGCITANPADPQADPPDTGTAGWSLTITPKGGGGGKKK